MDVTARVTEPDAGRLLVAKHLARTAEARHITADSAHQMIAEHLRSDVGGRCLSCGEMAPCTQRKAAHAVLFRDRRLPQRRRAPVLADAAIVSGPVPDQFLAGREMTLVLVRPRATGEGSR